MENQLHNSSVELASLSPSRTPLSENPLLLQPGEAHTELKYKTGRPRFRTKARALFADPAVPKSIENASWACTPTRCPTLTKPISHRQSVHATPLRTRKQAGRQFGVTSDSEASANDYRAQNRALHHPHRVFESSFDGSSSSLPQHLKTPCPTSLHISEHTKPSEHFALEQDEDFWKDHNVQVLIRIRPLSSGETAANGATMCLRQESPQALTWLGQPESRFTFDHVACATTTQEELFLVVGLPMVDNCIKGYNSSIFAYGQTGSGKTYTMMGDIEAIKRPLSSKCGMTPRIFEYLFTRIEMEEAICKQEQLLFTCKCSFLEIYNEQITDLLEPTSTNLQIHEDPKRGLFVENLKEIEVKNVGDVMELLVQGAANRRVAQTRMNQESSRSHCVFTFVVESQWVSDSTTSFRFGRLNLVDLAGSERQKASGADGERLREAANINKSLSTLSLVIMILVDAAQGKQRHVPYRDSKLTFLLQDSLGGNSKTAIIATVSPAISCANETLGTLKFAQRAKFIQNNAVINENASGDVKALQTQIEYLKSELKKLKKQAHSTSATQESAETRDAPEESKKLTGSAAISNLNNVVASPIIQSLHERLGQKEALGWNVAGCLESEKREETKEPDSSIQAYEREISKLKTMLQLKEEKIQRLQRVEDASLSADKYSQAENTELQQELTLLKYLMSEQPELRRFAFENMPLLEWFRTCQEPFGEQQDQFMIENANKEDKVLDLLQHIISRIKQEQHIITTNHDITQDDKRKNAANFTSILQEENLMTHNHQDYSDFSSEGEKAQGKLVSFLDDGSQALDEALKEVESMKESLVNETKDKAVNWNQKRNKSMLPILQHVYNMAKDVENRVRNLSDVAMGENKRKRSVKSGKGLPAWREKRAKALYLDLPSNRESDVNELALNSSTASSASSPIKNSKGWQSRKSTQSSTDIRTRDDSVCLERKHEEIPAIKAFPFHKESSNINDHKASVDDFENFTLEDRDCIKPLSHESEFKESQDKLQDVYVLLENEINRANANLRYHEKQWLSEKRKLKRQILKLQSEAVAKDKEMSALRNEEATLSTVVKKLHVEQETITQEFTNLTQQLEQSRNEKALASFPEEENDKMTTQGASEQQKDEPDSLEKQLQDAQTSIVQMQKQIIMMEAEMSNMLAVLESRLQEAEDAWREERAAILMEFHKAKLDAAEKICQATEAFKKFIDGQEIIKEAELTVHALITANESGRVQKLSLMSQWEEERESMLDQIAELKTLITQKEEELQLKEREAQAMLMKIEGATFLAKREITAFVADAEEETVDVSNAETNMERINAQKPVASDANDTARTTAPKFTQEMESKTLQMEFNYDPASIPDYAKEQKGKQPIGTDIEASVSRSSESELIRKSQDVVKQDLQHQAKISNAMFCLALQEGKESESGSLKNSPTTPNRQWHDSYEALTKIERATTFHTGLQKNTSEIRLTLQSYDETTSQMLKKLERIVTKLPAQPGGEDAWICFLNAFELALLKLEEDTNLCMSFSNGICKKLDQTLAEKHLLEHELERKQVLLNGTFFDLSLLQESAAEAITVKTEINKALCVMRSLQEDLETKCKQLNLKQCECADLALQNEEKSETIHVLETSLSEAQQQNAFMERQENELRQSLTDALEIVATLEANLEQTQQKTKDLEADVLDINLLVEQKTGQALESLKQEFRLACDENNHLKSKLLTLEEQLEASRTVADSNKRLAAEAQQIAESSNCRIQKKEKEIKLLERLTHELENTINALESQMEMLKGEAEIQQLSKEDLEMELQAMRHQICILNSHADGIHCADMWCKRERLEDKRQHQHLEAQSEIIALRKELAEKVADVKSLKDQIDELIMAAEKQAHAHHQKLICLEAMVDNFNLEKGDIRQANISTKAKSSTSPFKCMSTGLVEQINFEMGEELYSNRRRINELEDLAASRQKEIFRLNQRLAEAETMTYDVIRDLLGVKCDIATHASCLNYEEFEMAANHHSKTTDEKEQLKALQEHYNEERASWLEDRERRQAEVLSARIAADKLRQKDFVLKVENKRLKADLSRQKKRILQLQEKVKGSVGLGDYDHCFHAQVDNQDYDVQDGLRRTKTLLDHVDNQIARRRRRTRAEIIQS